MIDPPSDRPRLVGIAGPNGAGKTTFYHAHVRPSALRLVNADVFAKALSLEAYEAARLADVLRRQLVAQRESFAFETVFSDPVGDKVCFLREAGNLGYSVLLCFIGVAGWRTSEQRVAMRVAKGGHDVPREKLIARFPRTIENLGRAIRELEQVRVYDNEDLRRPYRLVGAFRNGTLVEGHPPIPRWLRPVLP